MTPAARSGYTIGLDLGGGTVRCLLLDLATGATTCAHHAHTMHTAAEHRRPGPGEGGSRIDSTVRPYSDVDPKRTLNSLLPLIQQAQNVERQGLRVPEGKYADALDKATSEDLDAVAEIRAAQNEMENQIEMETSAA